MIIVNRAGRKRKSTVARRPDGKSLGEPVDYEFFARQPHRRSIPASDQIQSASGSPLGRLWFIKTISDYQRSAGDAYALLCRRYAQQIGMPLPTPRSGSLADMVSGGFYSWAGDGVSTEEQQKRIARTRQDYDECHCALGQLGREHRRGNRVLVVMNRICVLEDEWFMSEDDIGNLRLGLNCAGKLLISDTNR